MAIFKKNANTAAMGSQKAMLRAAGYSKEELFRSYNLNENGYDEERVEEMRDAYGDNTITAQSGPGVLHRLWSAFINPFTVVLLVLAGISLFTDVIVADPGSRDFTSVAIVVAMVLISGTLRFVQESRSNAAAEKLGELVETTCTVQRRETGKTEIPLDEVVVGDIVYLTAGDMIPADLRIIESKDLFVAQSSLTGESAPVEKLYTPLATVPNTTLACENLAFLGTNVVSGSATAVVVAVGDETVFGDVARSITGEKPKTSFEKGVNSVSWLLIRFMLIMVPVVLFVNGFTKGDWVEAFLFALSVAVGLTPEMLPMIVSTGLAKGAVSMSKKDVIVKDLGAIQNLGAIDVLCTDKTGTLTEDRVVLEHYLDVRGNEDTRVLRHAFLNSYHQTGLKNLMDMAIIEHADEKEMVPLWQNYHKVDEVPFDFARRRMSVVVQDDAGKSQMITKGAIEEMISVCDFVEQDGAVLPLDSQLETEIIDTVTRYNEDGLRVLGIAQKTNPSPVGAFGVKDEAEMVLIGLLAFLDPPKESAAAAIAALNEYGVGVKVLTGDNDAVARSVCRQVGIDVKNLMLGSDVDLLGDDALAVAVERTEVFAKLSPQQKVRIVAAMRQAGHTVGFMGDGINDAAAMKESDVGISVDTAVDIAKESADIILLQKDLLVLEEGIIEGRKTYANTIKYIKMTASSNFGNMFSVLAASAFLPFLPMLPIQLLVLNLIYDISCIAIPWDNVDADYLKVPRRWDASSIGKFMVWIGPTSSVFDITTYLALYFLVCPAVFGGQFHTLGGEAQAGFMALFHAGWFVESLWTQTLVIQMIRTKHIPFVKSSASWQVNLLTGLGILVGTALPYTFVGRMIGMGALPLTFFPLLIITVLSYVLLVSFVKYLYIRRNGELL